MATRARCTDNRLMLESWLEFHIGKVAILFSARFFFMDCLCWIFSNVFKWVFRISNGFSSFQMNTFRMKWVALVSYEFRLYQMSFFPRIRSFFISNAFRSLKHFREKPIIAHMKQMSGSSRRKHRITIFAVLKWTPLKSNGFISTKIPFFRKNDKKRVNFVYRVNCLISNGTIFAYRVNCLISIWVLFRISVESFHIKWVYFHISSESVPYQMGLFSHIGWIVSYQMHFFVCRLKRISLQY